MSISARAAKAYSWMMTPSGAATQAVRADTQLMLALILLLGIALRLYDFTGNILDHHALRQVDTDAMARNFVHEGMNPFLPRVDWRGAGDGITEAEFPLFTYLVAILYWLFGEHVELARGLNLVFFTLTAVTFFNLGQRLFDARTALFAVFFYCVSPMAAYFAHSLQPDTMMLLGLTAGLYYFIRWCDHGRKTDLAISALGIGLALTVKPLNVYMAFPLLYLCANRFGWKLFLKWEIWAYGAAVVAPALGWYFYSYSLWIEHSNTLYRAYASVTFSWLWDGSYPAPLVSVWEPSFLSALTWRFVYQIATPGGLLFLLFGTWLLVRERNWLILAWAGGFILTMAVFAYQHRAHDYYQLPLVLVGALAIGRGLSAVLDANRNPRLFAAVLLPVYLGSSYLWFWRMNFEDQFSPAWAVIYIAGGLLLLAYAVLPKPNRILVSLSLLLAAACGATLMTSYTRQSPALDNRVEFSERLAHFTKPEDRIIIAHNWFRPGWFQHIEQADGKSLSYDPFDFYFSRRKGWSVSGDMVPPQYLEVLRQRGATYFGAVCCTWSKESVMKAYPELMAYLDCAHTPLEKTENWVIYRLGEPKTRPDGSSCMPATPAR